MIWTDPAIDDLAEIREYISADSPAAASGQLLKVVEAVEGLELHPTLGRPGRIAGTRELIVPGSPYVVACRSRPETVTVLRVFHGAREWPDQM